MADLKKCPNCGKLLAGDAETCSRCGESLLTDGSPVSTRKDRVAEPISSRRTSGSDFQKKRGGGKKYLKIALAVFAAIVVIGAVGSRNSSDKPDEPDRSQTTSSQAEVEHQEVTDVPAAAEDHQEDTDVPATTEGLNKPVDDQEAPEESEASSNPGTGDLGDYHVEIKGAVLTEDFQGNPAIVITYNWTNNSEKTTSVMVAVNGNAFQDGIGLETAIIGNPDVHDGNAYMTEIRPGASLDVSLAYVLKNTSSIIEFELSELISFSNDVVSMIFNPGSLSVSQ